MPRIDKDRAAKILVDAAAMGDRKAAEKWEVSERTIRNYRKALPRDPELSSSFRENAEEADRSWHLIRNRFLRDVTEHLRALCLDAKADQIDDVRAALKDIGELELAREALGVGAGARRENPSDAASSGEPAGDEQDDSGGPR